MTFYHVRCCFRRKQQSTNWSYIFAIFHQSAFQNGALATYILCSVQWEFALIRTPFWNALLSIRKKQYSIRVTSRHAIPVPDEPPLRQVVANTSHCRSLGLYIWHASGAKRRKKRCAVSIGVTDTILRKMFIHDQILNYSRGFLLLYTNPEKFGFKKSIVPCYYLNSELWTDANWHAWRSRIRLFSIQDVYRR